MKEFFDTSVLVAAFWVDHPNHEASFHVVNRATPRRCAIAAHTLAEFYATMTALPLRDAIEPDQVLLFIEEIRKRCTLILLTADDYTETVERMAEQHQISGRIYDALILCCASKWQATAIYTWNLKHFKALDTKLSSKVRTP